MPIEIRELVIKATISQNDSTNDASNSNVGQEASSPVDINEIVALVFEKIKEKMER